MQNEHLLDPKTQMVFLFAFGKYLFGPFTPTDNREKQQEWDDAAPRSE
jgi:hypothetical protein